MKYMVDHLVDCLRIRPSINPANKRCFWLQRSTPTLPHPLSMFQQHLGMQRRPDGASVSAEKPVNTLQGAQNMHSHPGLLSPIIPNDPFMDTTPDNRHGLNSSSLGLYGEGSGSFDFGGQPQPSGPVLNQMHAHQFDQPSAGYNLHATPYSDPGSRGHSIPPATPMMGEHPGLRGYSVPPLTPQFHNAMHRNDSLMGQNNCQQQLLTELQKMNAHLTAVESASQIILANQQTSTECAQQHDNILKELLESIDAMTAS
jgi:hypothetical protein